MLDTHSDVDYAQKLPPKKLSHLIFAHFLDSFDTKRCQVNTISHHSNSEKQHGQMKSPISNTLLSSYSYSILCYKKEKI